MVHYQAMPHVPSHLLPFIHNEHSLMYVLASSTYLSINPTLSY